MIDNIEEKIIEIYKRKIPPNKDHYLEILNKVNDLFNNEDKNIRPRDKNSKPGGLLHLKKEIPTIIIPDLHARTDFLLSVMLFKPFDEESVLEKMANDNIQVVCVGYVENVGNLV